MNPIFESKRDGWIVALIWAGALMSAFAAVDQIDSPMSVLFAAAAGFMLWVLYGIRYTLTDEHLLVRCGPFRSRVPLAEIDSVTPSRNPLSSPAASLDRLLIRWASERRRILVSPADKAGFLRELDRRCPQLRLDGERLVGNSPAS